MTDFIPNSAGFKLPTQGEYDIIVAYLSSKLLNPKNRISKMLKIAEDKEHLLSLLVSQLSKGFSLPAAITSLSSFILTYEPASEAMTLTEYLQEYPVDLTPGLLIINPQTISILRDCISHGPSISIYKQIREIPTDMKDFFLHSVHGYNHFIKIMAFYDCQGLMGVFVRLLTAVKIGNIRC